MNPKQRLRYRLNISELRDPYRVLFWRYIQRPVARIFICWVDNHDKLAPDMTTLMALSSGRFRRCRYCNRFLPKEQTLRP